MSTTPSDDELSPLMHDFLKTVPPKRRGAHPWSDFSTITPSERNDPLSRRSMTTANNLESKASKLLGPHPSSSAGGRSSSKKKKLEENVPPPRVVVGSSYSRSTMVRNQGRVLGVTPGGGLLTGAPMSYYPGDSWRGRARLPEGSFGKATNSPEQAKQASGGGESPDPFLAVSHWELYHSAMQLPDGKMLLLWDLLSSCM